jgi:hypothetical protein
MVIGVLAGVWMLVVLPSALNLMRRPDPVTEFGRAIDGLRRSSGVPIDDVLAQARRRARTTRRARISLALAVVAVIGLGVGAALGSNGIIAGGAAAANVFVAYCCLAVSVGRRRR